MIRLRRWAPFPWRVAHLPQLVLPTLAPRQQLWRYALPQSHGAALRWRLGSAARVSPSTTAQPARPHCSCMSTCYARWETRGQMWHRAAIGYLTRQCRIPYLCPHGRPQTHHLPVSSSQSNCSQLAVAWVAIIWGDFCYSDGPHVTTSSNCKLSRSFYLTSDLRIEACQSWPWA